MLSKIVYTCLRMTGHTFTDLRIFVNFCFTVNLNFYKCYNISNESLKKWLQDLLTSICKKNQIRDEIKKNRFVNIYDLRARSYANRNSYRNRLRNRSTHIRLVNSV